jgi:hypothetical protein
MSGEINVISRTQQIIVDPVSSTVSVINAGPPGPVGPGGGPIGPSGPQGPPGIPGVSVVNYGYLDHQGGTFSGVEKPTGLSSGTFTLPTIQPNNFIELSVWVPRFIMSSSSVGWPLSQGTIELRVKNAAKGNSTLLFGQVTIPGSGTADPNGPPSLFMRTLFDPTRAATYFPPNSKLNVMGVLGGKSTHQGYVRLDGDSGILRADITVRIV